MADTYHAIKLYKTTANSTTSSKRVGINVTDSTVTTGYALYVNGAINVTDSLNTNSLNTGDLVVTGSASFTNGVSVGDELKFNKISAPTASGGTTYGNGTNGQVLKSNGTTVYWASDSNSDTKVTQAAAITTDGVYPIILGYSTVTTAVTNTVNKTSTLTYNPSTKALKTGLTTTANAIAVYSDANGTFSTKATASGAAYATAANGALTFGTLPVAQGGTGATTAANARTQLGITPANIGAATSSHTHFYLVPEGDKRTEATTPNSYNNNFVFRGLKINSSFGSPSSDTYSYVIGLRGWSNFSGGNSHELAFNDTGVYWRSGATTSWGSWYSILTSKMYGTNTENFLRNDGSWARPELKITLLHSTTLPTGDNYKNLGIHSLYVFITNPSSSFTATMVPFDWVYNYTGNSNAKSILLSDEVNYATAYIFWNGSSVYIQRNAGENKTWYIYGID